MKRIKAWHVLYIVVIAIVIIWLACSSSLIAGVFNHGTVRKVDFDEIREKYEKDYVYCAINNGWDYLKYVGGMYDKFSIFGWAFCETSENNMDRCVSYVLQNPNISYELIPEITTREDVPNPGLVDKPELTNNKNGYIGEFSLSDVKNGVYDLYLCVWENETNHGMSYTFYQVIKNGDHVEIVPWSTSALEEPIAATEESATWGYLDEVSIKESLVSIRGWEFAWDMESKEQSVYVEITDPNGNTNQYPAKMMSRSDVARAYDDQRYAQSGYLTTFENDGFTDGTYTVHALVENGGDVWRSKQYTVVKNGDEITVYQH